MFNRQFTSLESQNDQRVKDVMHDRDHRTQDSHRSELYQANQTCLTDQPEPRDRSTWYHRRSASRSQSPRNSALSGSRSHEYRIGGYHDRDAPCSRSRSPLERFVSRDVILEGLGGDVQDDDVVTPTHPYITSNSKDTFLLKEDYARTYGGPRVPAGGYSWPFGLQIMKYLSDDLGLSGIQKVTLIRDRKTGLSRGFAFVRFETTKDSMAFVEFLGPTFKMGKDKCRIAFTKERDETIDRRARRRDDEGTDWTCRVCLLVNFPRRQECFRCSTPRPGVAQTGPLSYLPPTYFTNDGERDMASSPPSQFLLFRQLESGVTEEILSKGVLKLLAPICPHGAAENSLHRILLVRDRRTNESWRYGFAEFATSTEAQKAFQAYQKMDKFTISSKPVIASYIHPGVFVPVYNHSKEAENRTFLTASGLRLAYWDDDGVLSGLQLGYFQRGESNERPSEKSKDSKEKFSDRKGKKRKAESPSIPTESPGAQVTKRIIIPQHLQFWQNRHSELHGLQPHVQSSGSDSATICPSSTSAIDNTGFSTSETFADVKKMACLLCKRGFQTSQKLYEHERVSILHSENLKNPVLLDIARKKMEKYNSVNDVEYRDRAKERRQVFGPSKLIPSSITKRSKSPGMAGNQGSESKLQQGKGALLLGKMGWSAGQGLGASGEGRTEHLIAEMYTSGVGLGAHGAKVGDVEEIIRAEGDHYENFVQKTKQKAKERFKRLE